MAGPRRAACWLRAGNRIPSKFQGDFMTYVFIGAFSQAPDSNIKLTRFGQRVELPADIAADTTHPRGLPCIPAEAFDKLGFTEAELKKYGVSDTHEKAPAEFL